MGSSNEALDYSDTEDEALRYTASAMFCTLHTLVEKSQLYRLKNEELNDWSEVSECKLETRLLLLVFCEVALRMMEVHGELCMQGPATQVMEVEENEKRSTEKCSLLQGLEGFITALVTED